MKLDGPNGLKFQLYPIWMSLTPQKKDCYRPRAHTRGKKAHTSRRKPTHAKRGGMPRVRTLAARWGVPLLTTRVLLPWVKVDLYCLSFTRSIRKKWSTLPWVHLCREPFPRKGRRQFQRLPQQRLVHRGIPLPVIFGTLWSSDFPHWMGCTNLNAPHERGRAAVSSSLAVHKWTRNF